jgi:hypothetical protein
MKTRKEIEKYVVLSLFAKEFFYSLINFHCFYVLSTQDIPKSPSIGDTRKETEEILNSILPPRCWEGK